MNIMYIIYFTYLLISVISILSIILLLRYNIKINNKNKIIIEILKNDRGILNICKDLNSLTANNFFINTGLIEVLVDKKVLTKKEAKIIINNAKETNKELKEIVDDAKI